MKIILKIQQNDFTILCDPKNLITPYEEGAALLTSSEFNRLEEIPELNFEDSVKIELIDIDAKIKHIFEGKFSEYQERSNITQFFIVVEIPYKDEELEYPEYVELTQNVSYDSAHKKAINLN